MMTNPVGWFELPCVDIERAQSFYENVFGFTLKRQDIPEYLCAWFHMDDSGYGASGMLVQGEGYQVSAGGAVVYFSSNDIEDTIKKAEQFGGKAILHKKDIGEYGYIGWVSDCEGNTIGLHTRK